MSLARIFVHWFTPQQSNAHKPKILHLNSLLLIVVGLLVSEGLVVLTTRVMPQVLGYAASIPPEKIIELTNVERIHRGLSPLRVVNILNQAALAKAGNMFAKNYWAHNAPDGTQPWFFITSSGYQYIRAGENLARDFTDPASVVVAWVNSPSHRENLLNPDYQDIGVAVVDGMLGGAQTTLVVQMFGTRAGSAPRTQEVAAKVISSPAPQSVVPTTVPSASPLIANAQVNNRPVATLENISGKPLFNSYTISRSLTSTVITILIVALALDMVLVWRRRILRLSGRSWAHLTFLLAMLVVLVIIRVGNIL